MPAAVGSVRADAYIARMVAALNHCRSLIVPVLFCLLAVAAVLASPSLQAHPEDEFCVPGEDGLDPALCRALAALNSSEAAPSDAELAPLLNELGQQRSAISTFALYVKIGVGHILPGGLDHILFVLALFLASTRGRALLIQITAFTVAHTVTLGLAANGVIAPDASIVEPFIAFTIAFVAVENLFFKDMTRWRPGVVFVFGLIHGLGFAGFFGDLGLPGGQFWSALLGFNVGVEMGQLSVVAIAFLLAMLLRRRLTAATEGSTYRRWVVVPASSLIAITGLWWAVQRLAA